jgi:Rad51
MSWSDDRQTVTLPGTTNVVTTRAGREEGGKAGRFVYSCAVCGDVLDVRKELASPDCILDSLMGTCPSCGAGLEDSIDCRLGSAPDDWQRRDVRHQAPRVAGERRKRPLFQSASSFNRFSLDFSPLDALVQPLTPDHLLVLEGHGASAVAELAAFRAQLPRERGGLDSTTVFVDGGNCSDPYLFASLARRYSLDVRKALRRVTNCRIFTSYQLANVLSKEVMGMVETYGSKLLVVAGLLGTFNEPDTSDTEAGRLLDAIHAGIVQAQKKGLIVIATLGTPCKYDMAVTSWADTVVRLSPARGERLRAQLLKHRDEGPKRGASEFTMDRLLYHPDSPLERIR